MASDGFFPGRDHVTYNDALAASKPFGMGDASQTSGKVDQMKFDDEAAGWDFSGKETSDREISAVRVRKSPATGFRTIFLTARFILIRQLHCFWRS